MTREEMALRSAGNSIIDNRVPFCCATEIPSNFDPETTINEDNLRLIFNTHKLRCVEDTIEVEFSPNSPESIDTHKVGPIMVDLDVKRLVGCIEYGAAIGPVRGDDSFPEESTAPICCYNTVCVDNIICANCDCPDLDEIEVEDFGYEIQECANKTIIVFTGVFVLPDC